MNRKRFSVEQIVAVLKHAEIGLPLVEICRQAGITEHTLLSLEEAVRRFGDPSGSAAEAASGEKREAEEVVFLGNPRKLFILNRRPVRTRTADLYRVKAGTSSTHNNLQGCWGLPSA